MTTLETPIELSVDRIVDISRRAERGVFTGRLPVSWYNAIIMDLVERTPDPELQQVISILYQGVVQ